MTKSVNVRKLIERAKDEIGAYEGNLEYKTKWLDKKKKKNEEYKAIKYSDRCFCSKIALNLNDFFIKA